MSRPTDPAAAKPLHPHGERALAEALGVAHDVLKWIRREKLTRGADWELVKGQVAYSDAGRATTLAAVSPTDSAPNPGPEKNRPDEPAGDDLAAAMAQLAAVDPAGAIDVAAEADGVETLVCAKLPRNPHILIARRGNELVRVRVKDSRNFRAGMDLPARHVRADLWQLEGKCPRYPGRF